MLRDLFHIHFQYFRHLAPFSTSEEPCKEQCSPCKYPRAKETAKQLLELRCEGVLDFTEILFLYLLMGSFYLSCVCVFFSTVCFYCALIFWPCLFWCVCVCVLVFVALIPFQRIFLMATLQGRPCNECTPYNAKNKHGT